MLGDRKELEALIEGFDTAILTTRGPDGHFHSRPMAVKRGTGASELWFVTSLDSEKCHDLAADSHCGVTFFAGRGHVGYVSISGTGEVVQDRAALRRKWSPSWRVWFPEGPDRADLALIRVRPEHAEYVHEQTGRLKVLFTAARRIVSLGRVGVSPKKELELAERPPPPAQAVPPPPAPVWREPPPPVF